MATCDMATCDLNRNVECELHVMTGDVYRLTVHLGWDVATLKEQIEYEFGYPCCSQVLSDDSKKLLSRDRLCDMYTLQGVVDSPPKLFLTCLDVPNQLEEAEVRRAWDAFRIHSRDYGETVSGESVEGVLRYLALDFSECKVNDLLADREDISFADALSIIAAVKNTSDGSAADNLHEDRFGFAALQDVDDLYVVSGEHIRPRRNWVDSARGSLPSRRDGPRTACDE
eukprot:TRINITY_DN46897_c0_g1_i1.p1 TRINITY_DN46897_c0_g1~~TRINITY_DN46897_c0_g1_i1.p1  ORF type:complete len:245 (+),score=26.88 TRINITY_DN46897_c0_g1_i1:57-737(+)